MVCSFLQKSLAFLGNCYPPPLELWFTWKVRVTCVPWYSVSVNNVPFPIKNSWTFSNSQKEAFVRRVSTFPTNFLLRLKLTLANSTWFRVVFWCWHSIQVHGKFFDVSFGVAQIVLKFIINDNLPALKRKWKKQLRNRDLN